MLSVNALLLKSPLIRQIRERVDRAGPEEMG
jgi:hypothetical protein